MPRSGKYFIETLKDVVFLEKSTLDIGTGYFGFLARHAKIFGSSKVIAVDLYASAIKSALQISEKGIQYRVGNVYSSVKPDKKFDIVISNPPQLPSSFGGKMHDIAGSDGMLVIKKIIKGFQKYVCEDGKMYLLIFDFLLDKTSLACKKNKLDATVIAYYNKHFRKGGETEKRKDVIEKLFKGYKFLKDENGLYHRVYILEIKKYEHNT